MFYRVALIPLLIFADLLIAQNLGIYYYHHKT